MLRTCLLLFVLFKCCNNDSNNNTIRLGKVVGIRPVIY